MNPALVLQVLQWVALVPQGLAIMNEALAEYEKLSSQGAVSDEQLVGLANRIVAQHAALPKPE
jgi:hypothetical protein